MLNRGQLVDAIVAKGAGDKKHVSNMLKALTEVATEEVELGNDFTIPGIVKIFYAYRKPQTRGSRWKKGDTVTGFGGIESIKDADSPKVTAAAKLKAMPTGLVGRLKPGSKPEAQSAFLKTKAGRAVAKRKG